jgi:molecular chaperone HtpG
VDSNTIDKLIKKEEEAPSKLDDKEKDKLKEAFERNIDKEKFNIVFENLSESDMPVIIMQNEFMRRMKDMEAIGGGGGMMGLGGLPESYEMVLNTNNPLLGKVLAEKSKKKQDKLISQMYDLARISKNLLKGKELTEFVKRSITIIE